MDAAVRDVGTGSGKVIIGPQETREGRRTLGAARRGDGRSPCSSRTPPETWEHAKKSRRVVQGRPLAGILSPAMNLRSVLCVTVTRQQITSQTYRRQSVNESMRTRL